jgi:hypothetical protein
MDQNLEQKFNAGDVVEFIGKNEYYDFPRHNEILKTFPPIKTVVWAVNDHMCYTYIIEHPEGYDKSKFTGFEGVPDKLLSKDSKYISVFSEDLKATN